MCRRRHVQRPAKRDREGRSRNLAREPVLLDNNAPIFADPDSAVVWSGNVRTGIRSDVSYKTFMGRGSGETFRATFEGPTVTEHTRGGENGGGALGSLFGDD
jgi:uncharacterized protein (AIM24 family)